MTATSNVYVNPGKTIRLGRVLDPRDNRAAVVAFDHGLHLGVIPGVEQPGEMMRLLADAGADAFLVGPGLARMYADVFAGHGAPGLILRVDWTNRWRSPEALGSKEGRDRMIQTVEGAARLGADAVLTYMFLGYEDPDAEVIQAEGVARMAEECERLGIGCVIEPMARGLRADHDIYNPEFVAMGARIASEFGADVLKTDYTGDAESFKTVTAAAFRPILIAGGPKTDTLREALEMVKGALDAGAHGMFIGRNVFQSPDPARMMTVLARMIHENLSVDDALEEVK